MEKPPLSPKRYRVCSASGLFVVVVVVEIISVVVEIISVVVVPIIKIVVCIVIIVCEGVLCWELSSRLFSRSSEMIAVSFGIFIV